MTRTLPTLTALGMLASAAAAVTVDFENPPLGAALFENGANWPGAYVAQGATFANEYLAQFDSWSGWALSRDTDTTTSGFTNQYSAWPGAGANGSLQYGLAYSGLDVAAGIAPTIDLPPGAAPTSIDIANTTYAALSMLFGDQFGKQFGGPSGLDPDWFRLTIHALDDTDISLASLEFFLADFRPAGTGNDFIRTGWTTVDLTPLQVTGVAGLSFRLDSSDVGQFGMNTPAYFAADNFAFEFPLTGDFNGDGAVDGADYAYWRNQSGDPHELQLWRDNFGTTSAATSIVSPSNVSVPEATSASLLILIVWLLPGQFAPR